jgi:hypothetical protein
MSAPVWCLSVDLQTKTASFISGMGDAAKAARGSFGEIRDGAKDMAGGVGEAGGKVNYSMMEARHGVVMLGEEFGVHLPRGITTFISSLGPVGAAMEAAFPFLAVILGATLLIEHLTKIGEEAAKAAEAGNKLGDDMTLGLDKAKEEAIDLAIEVRKSVGDPAWDLLGEKLKLKDADAGIENLHRMEKELDDLVKAHGPSGNWNPFNWLDGSDDIQKKIKSLKAEMQGMSQSEQGGALSTELARQQESLEYMRKGGEASKTQLDNEIAYVGWLEKEAEKIQTQADNAVGADQGKQSKDRADKAAKVAAETARVQSRNEMVQAFADKALKMEQEYEKKRAEVREQGRKVMMEIGAVENKGVIEAWKDREKLIEQLGKEEAEHEKKMAGMQLQAANEQTQEKIKLKHSESAALLEANIKAENEEYAALLRANQTDLAALDKGGKDYELKVRQLNDRQVELTQEHENKITQIKTTAQEQRDARILAADKKFDDALVGGMMKVLQGHESAAKMLTGIGQQIAAGMLENAVKSILTNDMTKESDAAAAARKAYLSGMQIGGPIGAFIAPAMAAVAFASVMAFEQGGIVPGVEKGDVVPARLTPGEGVIPKKLMDNLTKAANSGSTSSGETHVHHSPTYHLHMIDGTGVDKLLEKHGDKFVNHAANEFRKRNM